jgi:hypothetical protein
MAKKKKPAAATSPAMPAPPYSGDMITVPRHALDALMSAFSALLEGNAQRLRDWLNETDTDENWLREQFQTLGELTGRDFDL